MAIQQTTEANGRQTSFYLVQRAQALSAALNFFGKNVADPHHLLQFLAQIDFWEWELDNLIYSFTNLAERQKTWRSAQAATLKLSKLDIAIDAKFLSRVRWRFGGWQFKQAGVRVAPVDLLAEVLKTWSTLVDAAEARFVLSMQKKAERWNIQMRQDLNAFRRSMPAELATQLAEMDEPDQDDAHDESDESESS